MYEFMYHLKHEPQPTKRIELHENFFFPVSSAEVREAEKLLRIVLPGELKQFYGEIGWGQLQTGRNGKVTDNNYVASPSAVSRGDDIYLATKPTESVLNRILADGSVVKSGYGREYDYLVSVGYKWDAASGKMIKGIK